jgi:hypothetical protein
VSSSVKRLLIKASKAERSAEKRQDFGERIRVRAAAIAVANDIEREHDISDDADDDAEDVAVDDDAERRMLIFNNSSATHCSASYLQIQALCIFVTVTTETINNLKEQRNGLLYDLNYFSKNILLRRQRREK